MESAEVDKLIAAVKSSGNEATTDAIKMAGQHRMGMREEGKAFVNATRVPKFDHKIEDQGQTGRSPPVRDY